MCLYSINDFKDNDKIIKRIKKGIGWKVFESASKTNVITDTIELRLLKNND